MLELAYSFAGSSNGRTSLPHNKRQPDAAERYFAADYVEHNPHLPPGIAGKKQFIASVLKGFSDYHGEIEDIVAEGDKVVTRTLWTGTQDGPFLGRPATGNKVQFATSDFYRRNCLRIEAPCP